MDTSSNKFYSADAESNLIYLIFTYEKHQETLDALSPDWFYYEENKRIVKAAKEIRKKGLRPDLVTLTENLSTEAALIVAQYSRTASLAARNNADHYISMVKSMYARRQAVIALDAIRGELQESDASTDEILAKTVQTINDIQSQNFHSETHDLQQVLLSTYQTIADRAEGKVTTVSTGIPTLDRLTGGLYRGEMTVIGARPGTGKTALTLQIAEMAALAKQRVVFVSREMSETQIGERVFARHGIEMARSRIGRLRADDWEIAAQVMGDESLKNILIDNRSTTAEKIRTACRKWASKGGLDLICVDYLQLVHPENDKGSRNDQIASISWAMKEMAVELNVPVVLLSQLNRDVAKNRQDPRPMLSDLRDSGAIEQDADNVWMLWCPEKSSDTETQTMIEFAKRDGDAIVLIECEKARQSVIGTVRTIFKKSQMRFTDNAPQEYKEENQNEQMRIDG